MPERSGSEMTTLAALARRNGLTYKEMVFAALRELGLSQRAAYQYVLGKKDEPGVKIDNVGGNRYAKQIKRKTKGVLVGMDAALDVMTEVGRRDALLFGSHKDRHAAADQHHKLRGQYEQLEGTGQSALGALLELAAKSKKGQEEFDELMDKDMTRPKEITVEVIEEVANKPEEAADG